MPAEKLAFMLVDGGGAPKADAVIGNGASEVRFELYRDRTGADRTKPVITSLGLGVYGFEVSEADVLAATAWIVKTGADVTGPAFAASGSTRVFGAAFLQSQPWFVQLLEDGAGALWAGAAPTIGAWRDVAGGADASAPGVLQVAPGLWGFTPDAADLQAGRAFRWDAPAGAYPSYPHGAAHFDPIGTPGDSLGELIQAAITGDATVTALIASRIFPNRRPQTAALPLAVYSIISDVPFNALTGSADSRLSRARLQIDVYAKTYREAHQIAAAVDDVVANLGSPDISADRDTTRDFFDNETQLHRVSTDYIVLWAVT